jgi:hypothetical protein
VSSKGASYIPCELSGNIIMPQFVTVRDLQYVGFNIVMSVTGEVCIIRDNIAVKLTRIGQGTFRYEPTNTNATISFDNLVENYVIL